LEPPLVREYLEWVERLESRQLLERGIPARLERVRLPGMERLPRRQVLPLKTQTTHFPTDQSSTPTQYMDTHDFLQKPIMNPPQKTFPLSMVPVYGDSVTTAEPKILGFAA
jgi:hypothetical protein